MGFQLQALLLLFLYSSGWLRAESQKTLVVQNRCNHSVWPGIQPSGGKAVLADGGFHLRPGKSISISAPSDWSGRIWGRQGCSFNEAGKGSCATGDCGGVLSCNGAGGLPPATLAEFTFGANEDFYDVSLVDGYNMPLSMRPRGGAGNCAVVGCLADLNERCPAALQVKWKGGVVACKSACFAFNSPQYCCTGSYGNPQTCKPTGYSRLFKTVCPRAYSYAYDDPSSIVTCSGANAFSISFCPNRY